MPNQKPFTDKVKSAVQTKASFVNKVEAVKNTQQSKIETPQFYLDEDQQRMYANNLVRNELTDSKIDSMRQAIADINGNNEAQGFSGSKGSKITHDIIRIISDIYNGGENKSLITNTKVTTPAKEVAKVLTSLLEKNPNNNKFREDAAKNSELIKAIYNTFNAVQNAITSGQGKSR